MQNDVMQDSLGRSKRDADEVLDWKLRESSARHEGELERARDTRDSAVRALTADLDGLRAQLRHQVWPRACFAAGVFLDADSGVMRERSAA